MSSVSSDSPEHVEDVAQGGVSHRHGQTATEVAYRGAPVQPVGRLEAHAAHAALADLLGHLGGDGDLGPFEVEVHLDGHVDLGQRVGREFDVDDGPGDGDDAARRGGGRCRWWQAG